MTRPDLIHAEHLGDPEGRRLVFVHGFTQTGRNWDPVLNQLGDGFHVVVADAPGHGGSLEAPCGLWEGARAMAAAAGPGVWIGYSMGGRYALHVALACPQAVERLVVIGATGGIDDPGEREGRRRHDAALADRLTAVGLDVFLDEWLSDPMFAGLLPTAGDRRARRANTAAGLAASLRRAGTGSQDPLWGRLPELAMPVLAVAGGKDAKFGALAQRLASSIGANARRELIDGAGHAAHLERPEAFVRVLRAFVDGR